MLSISCVADFAIEPVSGELSVSGELAGAAREQPYELVVLAEDSGEFYIHSELLIILQSLAVSTITVCNCPLLGDTS